MEFAGEIFWSFQANWLDHDNLGYVFPVSKNYFIYLKKKGNLSRLVNHSCSPNLKLVLHQTLTGPRLIFKAVRNIFKHEELTYSYYFPNFGWLQINRRINEYIFPKIPR